MKKCDCLLMNSGEGKPEVNNPLVMKAARASMAMLLGVTGTLAYKEAQDSDVTDILHRVEAANCPLERDDVADLPVVLHEAVNYGDILDLRSPEAPLRLWQFISPINDILPRNDKVHQAFIALSNRSCLSDYEDSPLNGSATGGDIYIEAAAGTEVPTQLARTIAFHEAVHIFTWYAQANNKPRAFDNIKSAFVDLLNDKEPGLGDRVRKRLQNGESVGDIIGRHLKRNDDLNVKKDDGSVLSLFDESSYTKSQIGHPHDSYEEMISSAATVLHLFPDSFIENLNNLSGKQRQLAIATARKIVLLLFWKGEDGDVVVNDIFNHRLLTNLGFLDPDTGTGTYPNPYHK